MGPSQHARLITMATAQAADLPESLVVERFWGDEGVNELFRFDVDAISVSTDVDLKQFIGEEITLRLLQADGRYRAWHGYCTQASWLGTDGGYSRYRLRLESFLSFLGLRRDSFIFQNKTVTEIITELFTDYPQANFKIDATRALSKRAICTQYRETDLAFFTRLLASEGLSWYFTHEQGDGPSDTGGEPGQAHARHQLIIIDSSVAAPQVGGSYESIRFHRIGATEATDAISEFSATRSVQSNAVTTASWHPQQLHAPAAEQASGLDAGELPTLGIYDGSGERRFESAAQASAHAQLVLQALELGNKRFHGAGSVRQLAAGFGFSLTQHDHYPDGENLFKLLSVRHAAINNFDLSATTGVAATHGAITVPADTDVDPFANLERGTYRNRFTCVRQAVPIVPLGIAQRLAPTALGAQTALVVGLPGEAITTDRDHQIKVQFPWQRGAAPTAGGLTDTGNMADTKGNAPQSDASGTWVRVAEALAGPNWGTQFTPRINTEVLVDFIEGDIDRPVVVAQLYNGADLPPFSAGTNSDVNHAGVVSGWHSQALPESSGPDLGAIAAVVGGVASVAASALGSSKEKPAEGKLTEVENLKNLVGNGGGYNQMVFDDATDQLRIRLASSSANSQLNLGHLISQEPTSAHRGTYRGTGFELRTDAWGSLRGADGILVSTTLLPQKGSSVTSTQFNISNAIGQLKKAAEEGEKLGDAADKQKALRSKPAHQALQQFIAETDLVQLGKHPETVNGQAALKTVAASRELDASPHGAVERFAKPWVVFEGPNSIGWASPESTLVSAGEHMQITAMEDGHWVAGRTFAGVTAQATSLFCDQGGIQAYAANGPVVLQANSDQLEILADKAVTVACVNDGIEILANTKIVLQAGQSSVTLEGGDITFACPGTFSVKGGSHPFTGGTSVAAKLPTLQGGQAKSEICKECLKDASAKGHPMVRRT